MRVFIKAINNEFVSFVNEGMLQKEYPNFPTGFLLQATSEQLAEFNCYEVFVDAKPTHDDLNQNIKLISPYLDGNTWRQSWEITEKSPEEKRNLVPIVGMAQARKALFQTGKLELVNAAVQQSGGIAAIDWEYATEVHRDSPLVVAFVQQFGWTEDEVTELFQLAVTL